MNSSTADLQILLNDYLDHLRARRSSLATVRVRMYQALGFLRWVEFQTGDRQLHQLTPRLLEIWFRDLSARRSVRGYPLKPRSLNKYLETVSGFLGHLASLGMIDHSLGKSLPRVKEPRVLPTSVLTHSQMKRLLNRIDTNCANGCRDRAMLELLYSSGLRAAEILGLRLEDVNLAEGTALVWGKGDKQRVVPIGRLAIRIVKHYLRHFRPDLVVNPNEKALFLNRFGAPMPYYTFRRMIGRYGRDLPVVVTPHTFRRSCTTELIRAGANLYHIKELLGHETLDTLKHYARLNIADVKRTHAKCHPREREPHGELEDPGPEVYGEPCPKGEVTAYAKPDSGRA